MSSALWGELVKTFGVPTATLLAILYGSYKRIWVWGSEIKKVEAERDEWKEMALSGTNVADAITDYAIRQRDAAEAAGIRAARRKAVAEEANPAPPRRHSRVRQ